MPPGEKLLMFMTDEALISAASLRTLQNELSFFDSINELYLDFLNRADSLSPGESKYYMLCSLCRTQLLKSAANIDSPARSRRFQCNAACC